MELITNLLYWLCTGLLIPVTIFLLFFFVKSLIMIGGFYGHYLQRNKLNTKLNHLIEEHSAGMVLEHYQNEEHKGKGTLLVYLNRIHTHANRPIMLDKIMGDYEVYSEKELGQSKLLLKIGPMLGLMGTLIPMGPALVGLATGDVASMASNMQVAFATTVVGIIIGAIGFITLQVRQRWAADDMNILEYLVESFKEERHEA